MERTIVATELHEVELAPPQRNENLSSLTKIHERGQVFFFYRPLSTEDTEYFDMLDWYKQDHKVESIDDVARLGSSYHTYHIVNIPV
jgi:hypothetical protein